MICTTTPRKPLHAPEGSGGYAVSTEAVSEAVLHPWESVRLFSAGRCNGHPRGRHQVGGISSDEDETRTETGWAHFTYLPEEKKR